MLGSTLERVRLPDDLVARLEGKSSLGRLGLLIHSTAGFVDPGWDGHVTLELSNVANLPITIYHGMKIGQISFMQLSEPADAPYGSGALGSKYQGQRGPDAEPLLEELRVRMTILVTGGTGFVGRSRRTRCARRARRARARPRPGRRRSARRARAASSSRATSPTRRASRAAAEGCDAVVHLVAIIRGQPADFERVMVQGTRNLLAAAREAGVDALRADERARHERADRGRSCPTSPRSGRWSRTCAAPGSST